MTADTLCRRRRNDLLGMRRFQLAQLTLEHVIFVIRNFGCVLIVIAFAVVFKDLAQFLDAFLVGHRVPPSYPLFIINSSALDAMSSPLLKYV